MFDKQKAVFKTLDFIDKQYTLVDAIDAEIEFLDTDSEDMSEFSDYYRNLLIRVQGSNSAEELYDIAITHDDILEGLPTE